jgi:hypothetical protein
MHRYRWGVGVIFRLPFLFVEGARMSDRPEKPIDPLVIWDAMSIALRNGAEAQVTVGDIQRGLFIKHEIRHGRISDEIVRKVS